MQKYGPLIRSKSKFASSQLNGATLIASPLETVQEKGKPAEYTQSKAPS